MQGQSGLQYCMQPCWDIHSLALISVLMMQAAPDFGDAAGAPELLDQPQAEFKLGESGRSHVDSVSTQSPVDDFKALIQQGQVDDAVQGLQKAVYTLVDTSLGDRYSAYS